MKEEEQEDREQTEQREDRRAFCKFWIGCAAVASGAMVGYPVIAFMKLPERLGANKPLEMPLDRLAAGQAEYVDFRGQQLIVLAGNDGPAVFSASCPHLGCNVIWDAADAVFRCPCHGAMFNAGGGVIRGPVNAGLTKIAFEVKDGKLIVS